MINCHTEKEAKQKWCPFTRVAVHVNSRASGTAGNRSTDTVEQSDIRDGSRCIAGACMEWRFASAIWDKNREQWLQPGNKPEDFEVRVTNQGYCGLAGVPL